MAFSMVFYNSIVIFAGMEVPSIEVFGILITEPFTWLTNWLVAAFSFYFAYKLFYDEHPDIENKFWGVFFLFMGLASTTGGTAHGFITYVGNNFHLAAWIFTGLAVFAAEMASLPLVRNVKLAKAMRIIFYVQLFLMVGSILLFQNFEAVRLNSFVGMIIIVLSTQLVFYIRYRTRRNALIIIGILSNAIPALIHAIRFSYNEWFNFNDLSHVVMVGCFYILYYGASQPDNKIQDVIG
jgi:hypothetical protein